MSSEAESATERALRLLQCMDESKELTLRQASAIMPQSYPTLIRFRDRDYIRCIKVGGRYIVTVKELIRFLREGNYDPGSSDVVQEIQSTPGQLDVRIIPGTNSIDLTHLSPEERDRLGSPLQQPKSEV